MRIMPIGVGGLFLLGGLLLAGKAEVNAQVSAATPSPPACTPVTIEAPLELNTVVVGSLVKTIKVEKEVFLCDGTATSPPSRIRDVQLFTEVIEQLRTVTTAKRGRDKNREKSLVVVTKSFEVITCDKDINSATIKQCQASTPPSLSRPPFFRGCRISPQQPSHPIAMNTVAIDDFVKTIKAQKELFQCEFAFLVSNGAEQQIGPVIVDLNTLTEIIERKIELGVIEGETFQVVEKRVEEAVCVKTFDGVVHGCIVFPVPEVSPGAAR